MDKRMFDMSDFYRESNIKKTNPDCNCTTKKSYAPMNDCEDFCVMPTMNDCDDVLAMAFVNRQPLDCVYPTSEGYCIGTIFQNLNKPFLGGKRR